MASKKHQDQVGVDEHPDEKAREGHVIAMHIDILIGKVGTGNPNADGQRQSG